MTIRRWLACTLLLGCGLGALGCVTEAGSPENAEEPTASAAAAYSANCATLYADANYGGASLTVATTTANVPGNFNDVTSSVAVASGCSITLYTDAYESGSSVELSASAPTVPGWFNDAASSYSCSCSYCGPGLTWCGSAQGCRSACTCASGLHWCGSGEGCQPSCY